MRSEAVKDHEAHIRELSFAEHPAGIVGSSGLAGEKEKGPT
jgi:hypothetical protein